MAGLSIVSEGHCVHHDLRHVKWLQEVPTNVLA